MEGPLCRFGVQGRVLTGCMHHAIGDGRSMELLKRRLADADVPPAERTVRDYAAWEAEQDDDIEGWLGLIGDTDVRFDRTGPAEVWRSDVVLDGGTAGRIEAWCRANGVSPFVFALHVSMVLKPLLHASPQVFLQDANRRS